MSAKPNRRLVRTLLLVAAVISVGAILLYTTRTPLLLSRATRVNGVPSSFKTFWINADELLVLNPAPGANPIHPHTYPAMQATRFNLRTHQSTPCTVLSRELSRALPNGELVLSPDRKILLWTAYLPGTNPMFRGLTPNVLVEAVALDGSRCVERTGGLHPIWMSDSQGWVETEGNGTNWDIEKQTLNSSAGSVTRTSDPFENLQGTLTPSANTLDDAGALGYLPDGFLLYSASGTNEGGPITLFHIAPRQALRSCVYTMPTPSNGDVDSVALSPQGNRLVWAATSFHKQWYDMAFTHWLPAGIRAPSVHRSIYVSNTDGSGMRLVGYVENGTLADVTWMPDGQHLSFRYTTYGPDEKNELYTVPAD